MYYYSFIFTWACMSTLRKRTVDCRWSYNKLHAGAGSVSRASTKLCILRFRIHTHIDGSCSQSQVGRHTKCHCTRPRCCRRRLVREPPGRLNFQTTDHNISKDTVSMILTMNALRKHSDLFAFRYVPFQTSLSCAGQFVMVGLNLLPGEAADGKDQGL